MASTLSDFTGLLSALEADESTVVTCYDSCTGNVKYISLGVSKVMGFSPLQFIGNNSYELKPKEESIYTRSHSDGCSITLMKTFCAMSPNGDLFTIEKVCEPYTCAGKQQILTRNFPHEVTHDVNDEATYLRDLIENSCMPVYSVGCDGRIIWANKAMIKMMGYENHEDDYLGSISLIYHINQDKANLMMQAVLNGEALTECECTLLRRDGSIIHVVYNSNAYYDKNGTLKHTRCYLRDNTENMRLRKEKEEMDMARIADADLRAKTSLEASKLKSTFIATISHEIRTPINGVMGMASLLNMTSLTSEQKDYVDTIMSSADILLSLIGNVLDVTKIESGKFELDYSPFQLSQLVEKIELLVKFKVQENNIDFSTHVSPALEGAWLLGDANRVSQVLINFLSNAIKFTRDGIVRFAIAPTENVTSAMGNAAIVADEDVEFIRFEVQDSGIGIEDCSALFSPFVQAARSVYTDYGGSGLGLSISRQLVALMGGNVGISSEGVPGRGTLVWAVIPFKRHVHTSTNRISPLLISDAPLGTICDCRSRILVVDDNKVNRKILGRMLQGLGYVDVEMATNGQEAVAAMSCAVKNNNPYDIIFMDCLMPILDGWEATRVIRKLEDENIACGQLEKRSTVWALTATVTVEDKQKSLECGMDDFLTKPISIERLQQVLANWSSCDELK